MHRPSIRERTGQLWNAQKAASAGTACGVTAKGQAGMAEAAGGASLLPAVSLCIHRHTVVAVVVPCTPLPVQLYFYES